jgi:type IV secretory pathway TraG/TraD family ATPase VirD4
MDAVKALVALVGVMALLAAPPFLVAGAWSFDVADLSPMEAMVGTVGVVASGQFGDPRGAYPAPAREQMPAGGLWWLVLLGPLGGLALLSAVGLVPVDVLTARRHLGRRAYDVRGARPREWARPRDVRPLVVSRRSGRRMTLGSLDGRLLAGDPEAQTMVCAPPRAGKTTGYIIPWLLEHDGPAVVTSTKRDVWQATAHERAKGGRVWVYDPFWSESCHWNPLEGCEDWGRALRQAHWLTDAASRPGQGSHVEEFWAGEASKLLAPLLHAAALGGNATIGQVVSWLEGDDRAAPIEILRSDGDPAAQSQLEGVLALDPRNVGTTYMSTAHLLHAYRFPEVLATAGDGFTATHLLDGTAGTLYLTASSRHQRMLAPILVGLVSSVLDAAIEKSRELGEPLDPLLRVLLDETANCAPLQSLPGHLSDVAAYGVRIATVWQSIAQMRDRYGEAKDAIMGASTDKVFLGPITDMTTRDEVVELLGRHAVDVDDHSTLAEKATAQDLQQLTRGRALVVSGALPPAVLVVQTARAMGSGEPSA